MRTMMKRMKMIYSRWQGCKVTNLNHWRRCGYTSETRSAEEQVKNCCLFFETWKYDLGENLQIYMLVMFGFCPENPVISSPENSFLSFLPTHYEQLSVKDYAFQKRRLISIYLLYGSSIKCFSSQIHWYLISWSPAFIWTKNQHSSF